MPGTNDKTQESRKEESGVIESKKVNIDVKKEVERDALPPPKGKKSSPLPPKSVVRIISEDKDHGSSYKDSKDEKGEFGLRAEPLRKVVASEGIAGEDERHQGDLYKDIRRKTSADKAGRLGVTHRSRAKQTQKDVDKSKETARPHSSGILWFRSTEKPECVMLGLSRSEIESDMKKICGNRKALSTEYLAKEMKKYREPGIGEPRIAHSEVGNGQVSNKKHASSKAPRPVIRKRTKKRRRREELQEYFRDGARKGSLVCVTCKKAVWAPNAQKHLDFSKACIDTCNTRETFTHIPEHEKVSPQ